jgi:uncharacterized membrane protein
MIREHLFNKKLGADPYFRWRGGEISRIEGISDGVFAITITLLIVTASSSESFYNIWLMVRDLPAFFISFIIIIYAWFEHYRFFRRYGLEDGKTVILNSLFLFIIMILAYPLKFLTTFLWHVIIGVDTSSLFSIPDISSTTLTEKSQRIYMMYFYSISVFGVFSVIFLMHLNAYRLRNKLELDVFETMITKFTINHHIITLTVTMTSIIVLMITSNPGVSGIVYFLMPAIHIPVGFAERKAFNKLEKSKKNK